MKPLISLIIVNYNTCNLLRDCLKSISDHLKMLSLEIIVIDNASSDGSAEMVLCQFPEVKLIKNTKNTGFGHANNIAASQAIGKYLMLLNSDTVLLEDTATGLASFLDMVPSAGMVGPNVLLPNGSRQPKICGYLPTLRKVLNDSLLLSHLFPTSKSFQGINLENPSRKISNVGWISGVCMMIRKEAFDQVNGFDTDLFLYTEDIDLCRRMKLAGWDIYHLNAYSLIHYCGGSSSSKEEQIRNNILQQRHLMRLISKIFIPTEFLAAKLIMALGLLIRIAFSGLMHMSLERRNPFLLHSSVARFFDLMQSDFEKIGG